MGGIYDRKDEEFRLIDVDGLVLASPGDHIIINEPEDFDQASIREVREENHGIDFDFFTEESSLVFDKIKFPGQTLSGLELIEQVRAIAGSDLKINFQYRHNDETNPVIYEAALIGSSRRRLDYGISIRAKRVEFDDKFRTRQTFGYDINRTENYDGDPIVPVSYNDILLTPQAITKRAISRKIESEGVSGAGTAVEGIINWGNVIESNLTDPLIQLGTFVPANATEFRPNFILSPSRFGYFTLTYDLNYTLTVTGGNADFALRLLVVNELPNGLEDVLFVEIYSTESFVNGVAKTVNITGTTSEFPVNETCRVYFYLRQTVGPGIISSLTVDESELQVNGVEKSKFLNTKYVNLIDGIEKATEGITGVSNPIISPFLALQNAALMTGKLIRGFPETEPFKIRWDEMREFLRCVFGLGFAVLRRPAGNRVYIDQYSEFYRDVEIASYNNIAKFIREDDKEQLINEINIGYEKFSDGTDTVLLNDSNKDFLTLHQYLTPIERDKKEYSCISPITASGYVIEEGRQQSATEYPDEKWEQDDKLFIIALNENNNAIYDQFVQFYFGGLVPFPGNVNQVIVQNFIPTDVLTGVSSFTFDGNTYTVTAFIPDEQANRTTFIVSEAVGALANTRGDLVFTGTSWTAPESDEAFDVFNGVDDAKATYNARYNIKNMLFAQSVLINSGLEFKAPTSEYKVASFENNASLETQFSVGENYSTLDPDRVTVIQGDDIQKQLVNQGNQLFEPEIVEWELRVPFEEMIFIKDAHEDQLPYTLTLASSAGMVIGNTLNQTTGVLAQGTITDIQGNDVTVEMIDGKFVDGETVEDTTTLASSTISSQTSQNYGYISALAYDGVTYQAFLKQREYELMSEMFKFMGKLKK